MLESLAALSAAVEAPRQELFRRINTAPKGTETLVALRGDLHTLTPEDGEFTALDADLKHLMRSWFNRGFLRLERISWKTSAIVLEKLIHYESVHEINGWPDLRRRLDADRRCFAFFHPALAEEPIIFVEVALANGLTGNLEPLLDIQAPVLAPEKADTAIFYSINNCLRGLRGVAFGNFLIKQVVTELSAEFPNLKNYGTLSPLPRFSRALRDDKNEDGFTRDRLSRLLADFAAQLTGTSRRRDSVDAFFHLLEDPVAHREVLAAPLERLALAYLAKARDKGKLCDPGGALPPGQWRAARTRERFRKFAPVRAGSFVRRDGKLPVSAGRGRGKSRAICARRADSRFTAPLARASQDCGGLAIGSPESGASLEFVRLRAIPAGADQCDRVGFGANTCASVRPDEKLIVTSNFSTSIESGVSPLPSVTCECVM